MANVLCIGDVMFDVIAQISVAPQLINFGSDTRAKISTHGGGAGGNVASWLRVAGAQSHIVAKVGEDSAGRALIAEFDALGVSHANLYAKGVDTGVIVILVDPLGERTMLAGAGANSLLQLSDLPDLKGFDAVYLTGYALLNPASRDITRSMIAEIKRAGIPIFFDPATVGGMIAVETSEILSWLPSMHCVLLNEEEAIFLTGDTNLETALDQLLSSCAVAVIKRGSLGAVGKIRGGEMLSADAIQVEMIDTTGAGDSFAAGFIAATLSGSDLLSALVAATTIAAQCVAIIGARPRFVTSI